MSDMDIYDELPVEPEAAFLLLEKHYREKYELGIRLNSDDTDFSVHQMEYIAQVLGAIAELDLENEFRSDVPSIENVNTQTYLNFSKDVKNYCTRLSIRVSRRVQGFSVIFDSAAKQKAHHFIGQLRELFNAVEVDEPKREALFTRLSALENEIDRDRTRLEKYGELIILTAAVFGKAAEKLKPVQEIFDSISRLIYGSRTEEVKKLSPPKETKRIESRMSPKTRELDDEVPF
jgi:hypothetical protein